jgi:glycosyltransferase involved in cell wall biosynthesis
MKISVVIPTKNRHQDLQIALNSIFNQSLKPDEIILVDQSEQRLDDITINYYSELLGENEKIKYLYDPSIKGLVHAKSVGVGIATGDLICFLEDDIVLEGEYFKELIDGFKECKKIVGCCGVVTNPPFTNLYYLFFHNLFHRGIFKDKRPSIFANYAKSHLSLIPSNTISGGLSAWKSEVFEKIKFDVLNGFHMVEDIEFSTRVADSYPNQLYINSKVRLAHNFSPSGRDAEQQKQRRKAIEYIMFYKKHSNKNFAIFNLCWLFFGLLISSIVISLKYRNFDAIQGLSGGIIVGISKKLFIS